MQISILGAGWLGLSLGEALVADGHTVKASTTTRDKLAQIEAAGMQAYQLSIDREGTLSDPGDFFTTDLLIITLPPGGRRDPEVEERYPKQVVAIIRAAIRSGIRRLLFTSSTSVYGDVEAEVQETTTLSPATASGRALEAVEGYLQELTDLQVTILRLAGLAGPDRHPGRWFAGKKNVPNGQQRVNMVHREDVIGIIRAVIQQGGWGEVFNVCADEHPMKADFYRKATEDYGEVLPEFVVDPDGPLGKVVSNVKGREMLKYSYRFPDPMGFAYEA